MRLHNKDWVKSHLRNGIQVTIKPYAFACYTFLNSATLEIVDKNENLYVVKSLHPKIENRVFLIAPGDILNYSRNFNSKKNDKLKRIEKIHQLRNKIISKRIHWENIQKEIAKEEQKLNKEINDFLILNSRTKN